MSADPSLDRASFQQFLANAFAVQESQIDSRFLTAFLEVQRLVAGGELGIDGVMNLIVNSAQDVAHAAGVAVGLLEGDQLVYRAGSGCSTLWIGMKFAASLTTSSKANGQREILRVENAQTDTRIEGAICRQFGAEALLILPIHRDRVLAGVMEILFCEPHAFQDCEVRMYRLMAGLVEEAMHPAVRPERKVPAEVPAVLNAVKESPRSADSFAGGRSLLLHAVGQNISRRWGAALASTTRSTAFQRARLLPQLMGQRATEGLHAVGNTLRRCEAALATTRHISTFEAFRQPRLLAEGMVRRATEVFANKPIRSVAVCALVTALGLTFWMAHGSQRPATPVESPASRSTAASSSQPDKKRADVTSSKLPTPIHGARPAKPRSQRVQVGQTEVDYIGDDVTVRHFTSKPPRTAPPTRKAGQVAHIGQDVTVRYYSPKPASSSQTQ